MKKGYNLLHAYMQTAHMPAAQLQSVPTKLMTNAVCTAMLRVCSSFEHKGATNLRSHASSPCPLAAHEHMQLQQCLKTRLVESSQPDYNWERSRVALHSTVLCVQHKGCCKSATWLQSTLPSLWRSDHHTSCKCLRRDIKLQGLDKDFKK